MGCGVAVVAKGFVSGHVVGWSLVAVHGWVVGMVHGVCVVIWTARIVGHQNIVGCVAMLPCGKLMVSASSDSTLKIWSTVAPFECVQTLNGAPFGMRCHGIDGMG